VGVSPFAVAVTPDGTRAYVTNQGDGTVSAINTTTNTVIATIPVGIQPFGVDVAPEGSTVYVADASSNRVAVIDVASNTLTKTLPTDIGGPINVEVTARRVYVVGGLGQLVVIDRVVEAVVKVVSTAPDPENPFGFAFGLAVSEGPPLPGNPTITTQASPSNLEGTVFTDTATVTGGVNPTGEVVFTTYSDPNCVNQTGGNAIIRPLVNGTATAEAFLPVGTTYWRAVYTGDANNNPATHPCNAPGESVVVRPFAPPPFTRVITGDLTGPVTVNSGDSVQIINARVVGPITVNPGGSLVIENSQISGGIVATSPGFLRICGSQVSGPRGGGAALSVSDSIVPIVIGDVPNGCAGNRFAGNVNLIDNYGVTFNNNIVSANLTVNNGGPANTQLRQNTIFGNLACSGNNPFDATRPNIRNTVNGTRSGQCVAPF
jgi:YVTN family beta-propeller protein